MRLWKRWKPPECPSRQQSEQLRNRTLAAAHNLEVFVAALRREVEQGGNDGHTTPR